VIAATTGIHADNREHCPSANDVDDLISNESYLTADDALSGVLDPAVA